MTIIEIVASLGVVTFIIYTSFNIIYLVELRRTNFALQQLLKRAEENLHPALAAIRRILEDIGEVTDNAAVLSHRLRQVADMIAVTEKTAINLYLSYRDGVGEAARANIAGLKAGVKAGVDTLLRNINEKKEGSS